MAKLGYTWYPKDWGNSESVFELNLSERGLYRELIDLAMMNDNKTEIKLDVWCRKFAIELDALKSILGKLSLLNLIVIKGESLFIPSCESRLNLVRGGKKSKPTTEGISNLKNQISEGISEPISEGSSEQIEKEKKEKVKEKVKEKTKKEVDFDIFWDLYEKKVDKVKTEKAFLTLSETEIDLILSVVKKYVVSTPEVKFRKNPLTWLNGKCWNDIIETKLQPQEKNPIVDGIRRNSITL